MKWLRYSARSGSFLAQAEFNHILNVLDGSISQEDDIIPWLETATTAGSLLAASDLKALDQTTYNSAITTFRNRFAELDGCDFDLCNTDRLMQQLNNAGQTIDEIVVNLRCHRLLHCAASLGAIDIVNLLWSMGADINILNDMEETPLLCAFRSGHTNTIKFLIENGADLSKSSITGETALHWLVSLNESSIREIENLLAEQKAKLPLEVVHIRKEENEYVLDVHPTGTPLSWAVDANRLDIVRLLMNLGAKAINETKMPPIVQAVSRHQAAIVEEFMRYDDVRCRINEYLTPNGTLLADALNCDNRYRLLLLHGREYEKAAYETMGILIRNGANLSDINHFGQGALQMACAICDIGTIKWLLDNGCDSLINEECNGITPLYQSMAAKKLDVFRLLIRRGARTDVRFKHRLSILHFCASDRECGINFAAELVLGRPDLESFSSPETHDDNDDPLFNSGITPFHEAVLATNFEVANLYLEYRANPYALTNDGWTILAKAITDSHNRSIEAIKYLLENNLVEFIVKPEQNITALHLVASLSDYTGDRNTNRLKFKYILSKFSSREAIESRTYGGLARTGNQTPLHWAAASANYFAAWKLLEAGAEVKPEDDNGKTPQDLAEAIRRTQENQMTRIPKDIAAILSAVDDIIKLFKEWSIDHRHQDHSEHDGNELSDLKFSRLGFTDHGTQEYQRRLSAM